MECDKEGFEIRIDNALNPLHACLHVCLHLCMTACMSTDDSKHACLVQWHWLVVEAELANLVNGRKCKLPLPCI